MFMSDLHYMFVSYESSSEITMEVTNGDVRLIFHIKISLTPDVEKNTQKITQQPIWII